MEATQSATGGSPKIAEGIQPALDGLISAMAEHVASRAVYQLSGPSADAALAKLQQAYVALNDACDKAHLQLEAERLRVIREQAMAADAKFAGAAGGELKQMQDIQSQTAALFSELQKSAPPEAPPPEAPAASIERSRTAALLSSSLQGAAELQGQTSLEAAAADVIMVTAAPEGTAPAAAAAQPQGAPLQEATLGGSSDMIMAAADAPGPGGALQLQPPSALATQMEAAATAPAAPEAPQASAAPAGATSGTPATQQGAMPPPPAPSVSAFAAIQQHEPGSLAPSASGALTELLTASSVPAPGAAGQTAPAAPGAAAADGTAAPDEFMLGRMESLPQLPSMDIEGFLDL